MRVGCGLLLATSCWRRSISLRRSSQTAGWSRAEESTAARGLPETETNFCEIYDPTTQSSTQFAAPQGWTNIGDGPTVVLPDGTLMIGNTQGKGNQVGLLNSSNLTWSFGVGNDGSGNEQG